jgi:signal transduction histidine kinase
LDNAVKYTPAASKIEVSYLSADGQVKIVVSDNGPGIDPVALSHIFERFYRTDNARGGDGTGLGLAIAKALIDGQRGTISARSEPSNGTTFTVMLPQAPTSQFIPSPAGIS